MKITDVSVRKETDENGEAIIRFVFETKDWPGLHFDFKWLNEFGIWGSGDNDRDAKEIGGYFQIVSEYLQGKRDMTTGEFADPKLINELNEFRELRDLEGIRQ